jgi:hypothetical protein
MGHEDEDEFGRSRNGHKSSRRRRDDDDLTASNTQRLTTNLFYSRFTMVMSQESRILEHLSIYMGKGQG